MRLSVILLLFVFFNETLAQEFNLYEARDLFIEASKNKEMVNTLYEITKKSSIDTNYKKYTYNALAILLQSKYAINPFYKIKSFKEGKEKLDRVIHRFPNDIELRFLRFCVQNDTPEFINYKKNMQEDSRLIKDNISKSSEKLQHFISPIFKTLNYGRTSYTSR